MDSVFSDIIVVGAGPAGLNAANTAATSGVSVMVLDEQESPGGQIFRNRSSKTHSKAQLMGSEYAAGKTQIDFLSHGNINYMAGAKVWQVDCDGSLVYSRKGIAQRAQCRHLILATGAQERPMPIPGWTLPGVMGVGAAQILLKAQGLAPSRAVLAGAGPLLYLYAYQLIKVGSPPLAIVETQKPRDYFSALQFARYLWQGRSDIAKGMGYIRAIKRAGVARYRGAYSLQALGDEQVTHLKFRCAKTTIELDCSELLLHQGVIPNVQISRSLGLAHHWDKRQACFIPQLERFGATSNSELSIAGDGGGVTGAKAAAMSGKLAALHALHRIGKLSLDQLHATARPVENRLSIERGFQQFLDTLYPPFKECLQPADDVVVCRCEGVTAGEIRSYADIGCSGPNQTKAFGRCGMGPCQGRYCGLAVTELLSAENRQSQEETGYYRLRAPVKPVTLAELASLHRNSDA